MKNYKIVIGNTTTYFINGIKKYQHFKDLDEYEEWRKYDEKGNQIYYKNSDGCEVWRKYDENSNKIYYKDSDGYESWRKYDEKGNEIHLKNSNGYEWWSDDNPENPKNKKIEIPEDFNPFKK